jgi:hypothetical protein
MMLLAACCSEIEHTSATTDDFFMMDIVQWTWEDKLCDVKNCTIALTRMQDFLVSRNYDLFGYHDYTSQT